MNGGKYFHLEADDWHFTVIWEAQVAVRDIKYSSFFPVLLPSALNQTPDVPTNQLDLYLDS